jgi:hypothetical protein
VTMACSPGTTIVVATRVPDWVSLVELGESFEVSSAKTG